MLNRITFAVVGLVALIVVASVTVFYLAYDAGPDLPASVRTDIVDGTTGIRFFDDGTAAIEAHSREDVVTALGFTHAASRGWSMFLWRQVALGRSAEWFGDRAVPADRLARRLKIASAAEQAFTNLPDSVRSFLIAYSKGVNAALFEADVERAAPFVLEQIAPEPWQPWHSIAIERLLAWTGTPVTDVAADLDLRRLLRTYGFEHNTVTWVAGAAKPYLYVRAVTGDSGIPLFQDVEIRLEGTGTESGMSTSIGATVPGVPMMVAGLRSSSRGRDSRQTGSPHAASAWASLMSSSSERSYSDERPSRFGSTRYERIVTAEAEYEAQIVTADDGSVLISSLDDLPVPSSVGAEGDFRTVIKWSGQSHSTDIPLWRDLLLTGRSDLEPGLFDVGLLTVDESGRASVDGSPGFVRRDGVGNVFIAVVDSDSLARTESPLERFEQLVLSPDVAAGASAVLLDDTSPPREQLSERLLGLMPDRALFRLALDPERLGEALSYLRNWNGSYSGAEIAPSLLEAYLAVGEIRAGVADTTSGEAASRLLAALDSLSVRFGSDMSSWRWQRVQNRRLHYPGAAFAGSRLSSRFEPVQVEFDGHSTTFTWGPPSLSLGSRRPTIPGPSAAWEAVVVPGEVRIERRIPAIDWNQFLGAYLSSQRPLDAAPFPNPSDEIGLLVTLSPLANDTE